MQVALLFFEFIALFRVESDIVINTDMNSAFKKTAINILLTSQDSDAASHSYTFPDDDSGVG
jgi:hypothetical protein